MIIYPAIDLINGKCVRLTQGRFDSTQIYNQDPIETAQRYAEQGATNLHVVDLDGAKTQKTTHNELVIKMARIFGLKVQTGGGIRSSRQIEFLLNNGVSRVVIGSLAVTQPDLVLRILNEFGGESITLALDIKLDSNGVPKAATEGWTRSTNVALWDILDFYSQGNLKTILCTDISRDGMFSGPNIELYKSLIQRYPDIELQASGGVSSIQDIKAVKDIGCNAAIIGKALYEKKFSLSEALDAS